MSIREEIERYQPFNEQEEADRRQILAWIDFGVDIYSRKCEIAHLTASAWVVSRDRKYVLMAFHRIYNSWAWLGGHADGERNLCLKAEKEAMEESGLQEVRLLDPELLSLEVLTVDGHEKNGKYVSSHLHLNVTYLFEADMTSSLHHKPDENSQVGWIPVEEISTYSTEPWFVERIYSKLCTKVKERYSV